MNRPSTKIKKKGSVLVLGGGIGGIQASLDLADLGFKVYLVEKQSAIGGNMVKLDKTFPTNDCSMCMISPKLVTVGRHHNIQILTNSKIQNIFGDPGNFKVEVFEQPRYIDMDKCTACNECVQVCPVEVPNKFDENLIPRKAIYKLYPQASPSAFAIDKKGAAPCKRACPAHIHVQGYVALIRERKYQEALDLIRKDIPFPGICGRVCTHPCESQCTRDQVEQPVAICSLKRFVSDWEEAEKIKPSLSQVETRPEKIAIVGAGPAGLTAAYFLGLNGYRPVVFDSMTKGGGMMRYGIPSFRLPRRIIDREISIIEELGVEIKYNQTLGQDFNLDDLKSRGYKAVFLGLGAWKSRKLGLDGEDNKGVVHGVDFLSRINKGEKPKTGSRVAVIGGGNVAIDAARSAIRQGSEDVFILYRRSRIEMPAADEEIEEAIEEGIDIRFLVAPTKIISDNGRVSGVELVKMELGEPDESGRRRPVPIDGSEYTIEIDTIIPAIGQSVIDDGLTDTAIEMEWGTIKVDSVTLETNIPNVFAGGDAVLGPATVIEAIAAGKAAAESIHRSLHNLDMREDREEVFQEYDVDIEEVKKQYRVPMPYLDAASRIKHFDEVALGFTEEQAIREAERCLNCAVCSECLQCIEVCEPKAIVHSDKSKVHELDIGAVVLCPGFELTDPGMRAELGHGRFANVVTSLEFERILSASGPYQGEIKRPFDGKHPEKIAFLQCVGSRDQCTQSYCSAFCCMQATKEAMVAKEHDERIQSTIFYMDIRAFGKDFEIYKDRAEKEVGVQYIRSQISSVKEIPGTGNILVDYIDPASGKRQLEEFDILVLSVGVKPSPSGVALAEKLGVNLDEHGFCQLASFEPVDTNIPGIYVNGMFAGPKDIPETVAQASATASRVSEFLAEARGTEIEPVTYPEPRDVSGEEPRIGVFVCHCGINIAGTVDVNAVEEFSKTLPNVVHAQCTLFTCSQDSITNIKNCIEEYRLNRVVVASCTPRTHEPIFQDTLREAGLNPYLFEMANIREQCSWIHKNRPADATEKAKELVAMTVAKSRYLNPLTSSSISVVQSGIVIGSGVAGISAAIALAGQGYPVHLIEKSNQLGGMARKIDSTNWGEDISSRVDILIQTAEQDDSIRIHKQSEIKKVSGHVGNFQVELTTDEMIESGIIIVATGAAEYKPQEYLYGSHDRVFTQLEIEQQLKSNEFGLPDNGSIVMIQCVGSRCDDRLYCSRVCCTQAIKNALRIKKKFPDVNIYVLYRDIRTYGKYEDIYLEARRLGVIFLRYDEDTPPEVTASDDKLQVDIQSPDLYRTLSICPDIVILSAAVVAIPQNKELGDMLKVPVNADGFFLEAHVKLRPVDFSSEGIFVAGQAHAPKTIDESIGQALAAAGRACIILSHDTLDAGAIVSHVDEEKCIACLTCVRLCPFNAPNMSSAGVVNIEAVKCQGCGLCAGACPAKAIQLKHFRDEQIDAILEVFKKNNGGQSAEVKV